MIFQHARFQIWNNNQHPFKHSLADFAFTNPALPGVSDVESALNYILAVLYPQTQPAVANPAALPLVGNTINDMRVVTDDGDGKAAGYRWEQREGEASPSWHKIYDFDFGTDSILQGYLLKTQDLYIKAQGYDDLDINGVAVVGTLAGQSIFGGKSASTNLTLFANSGDGVGAATGYVQFGDNSRPTANNTFSFGTTANRWLKGWFTELQSGTMNLVGGIITDSSGAISFDNENLSTTGTLTVGSNLFNGATWTNSTGTISFDNENLTSTGFLTISHVVANTAASTFFTGTTIADFTFTNGNIASLSAAIDFNALNLTTTGTGTFGLLNVDNVRINANQIEVTNVNGNLDIYANGTGSILLNNNTTVASKNLTVSTGNFSVTDGFVSISGTGALLNVDNLRMDGNALQATNANGDVEIIPAGTGLAVFYKGIYPVTDSSFDIGKTGNVWNKLWLDGSIGDGTTEIASSVLQSLRDINVGVGVNYTIFWDGSKWVASAPDSEIDHGSLTGIADDDHTQYALLAGRAGGQSLIGGTAAGNNLNLESTSHGTKGFIQAKDSIQAFTDASYSGGWLGADVGGSSNRFRHVYTAGEFFGLRFENVGALPGSSANNVGRVVYLTTENAPYVDTGTTFRKIGQNKWLSDTVWDGVITVLNTTVSATILDARNAMWQLQDNTNDFETMHVSIKATSATNVRITVGSPLPAGSYRLIGFE